MNRRDFLRVFALSGATLAVNTGTIAQVFAQAPPGTLTPHSRNPVAHLLSRITFGATPDLLETVRRTGVEAYIEQQLNPERIDESALNTLIANDYPIINLTSAQIFEDYRNNPGEVIRQLIAATLMRAIYAQRSLYEMMVHFWTDHFNIYINKGPTFLLKIADDRDVIRRHALGSFHDLLRASATSPAMLFYLDNVQSDARYPNENYARELLELHTLGVNGGYTEADVKATAQVFTGWSLVPPRETGRLNADAGEFIFRPIMHDRSAKTVLGIPITESGMGEGEQLIEILATHRSTARFVSNKLVRRFVADDPPPPLVDQVTNVFLETNGDIKSMLRTIFSSDAFWTAPPKFKRPIEYVVGLLRALDYQIEQGRGFQRGIGEALQAMGHVPFNWPAPDGYPDVATHWQHGLLTRWNLALALMTESRIGQPNYERIGALIANSDQRPLDAMAAYLLGRPLTDEEHALVSEFADSVSGDERGRLLSATVLLLSSPAYQYR